jgi:hypothetical protein
VGEFGVLVLAERRDPVPVLVAVRLDERRRHLAVRERVGGVRVVPTVRLGARSPLGVGVLEEAELVGHPLPEWEPWVVEQHLARRRGVEADREERPDDLVETPEGEPHRRQPQQHEHDAGPPRGGAGSTTNVVSETCAERRNVIASTVVSPIPWRSGIDANVSSFSTCVISRRSASSIPGTRRDTAVNR